MPKLSAIHVYPVKGCAGVELPGVELDARGPIGDRRFMIVDAQGMFITQRDTPRLALITAVVSVDALELSAPGVAPLSLSLGGDAFGRRDVQVWRSRVNAASMGPLAFQWLSDFLRTPAELVQMDAQSTREASTEYAPPQTQVSFADGYPILLISQASLDHLNSQLSEALPMNRFRPNLVVSGTEPHAEDTWRQIRIGDVVLDVVKPCDRCTVTTIDQRSAIPGKEPLRTLATYRRRDNRIYFGQNLVHRNLGILRVGMDVEILRTGEPTL